jgi:hypothetical protein
MDLNPIGDNHIEVVWPKGECELSDWHQVISLVKAEELYGKLDVCLHKKKEEQYGQKAQSVSAR